jgi:hypothetical protein
LRYYRLHELRGIGLLQFAAQSSVILGIPQKHLNKERTRYNGAIKANRTSRSRSISQDLKRILRKSGTELADIYELGKVDLI